MIDLTTIEPGELVRIRDAEGILRDGVFTYINPHTAAVGVAVFAEIDPNGVCEIPIRRMSPQDIQSMERIARGSEAEVFFRGAALSDAVLTVLGSREIEDLIELPDAKTLDALVDTICAEIRVNFMPAKSRIADVTEKATDAFWQVVAAEFREIKTGDIDPLTSDQFRRYAESTVETWVDQNAD